MKSVKKQVVVVGAGPAGMCAAIAAAEKGAEVLIADENDRPGGQLFKQIHKFFGASDHYAGVRGIEIGKRLLKKLQDTGAEIWLQSEVYGIFKNRRLGMIHKGGHITAEAERIILACGGMEKAAAFPGSTLPGVMGAGAAQTMTNIYRVRPGRRAVIMGSGNVGLITAYHLLQAGVQIQAVVEAAPQIKGYEVHAAKLRRAGVPIRTGSTVVEAYGAEGLEAVAIASVDQNRREIPGTRSVMDADVLCLAVGLTPMTELAWQVGCKLDYNASLGGYVPKLDKNMETTVRGIFAAGDITGIEEASIAMEEGTLAGIAAAVSLGCVSEKEVQEEREQIGRRLELLRIGSGRKGDQKKQVSSPDRGKIRGKLERPIAVIECFQEIPCNPCEQVCPQGAITVGDITRRPSLDPDKCIGCGLCAAKCPGLAITIISHDFKRQRAVVEIPYEYAPVPEEGTRVDAVGRDGRYLCEAVVKRVRQREGFDRTLLVSLEIPIDLSGKVRGIAYPYRNIRLEE